MPSDSLIVCFFVSVKANVVEELFLVVSGDLLLWECRIRSICKHVPVCGRIMTLNNLEFLGNTRRVVT